MSGAGVDTECATAGISPSLWTRGLLAVLAAQFLSAMAAILIGAVAGGTLADWNIAATLIVVTACGFGLCLTASIAALRAINRWTCHSRFAQARISQS